MMGGHGPVANWRVIKTFCIGRDETVRRLRAEIKEGTKHKAITQTASLVRAERHPPKASSEERVYRPRTRQEFDGE